MADIRGALHVAIEHDGEALADIVGREVAEDCTALAVECHGHAVTLNVVKRIGCRDAVTGEVGALFDQQAHSLFLAFNHFGILLDDITGRKDPLSGVNLCQDGVALRVNKGELEFRHALELLAGPGKLFRVEPGNLDQDAVAALGGNDWFAHPELVHAFADDLDSLVEGRRGDFLPVLADQTEEERSATLQVETETDFLLRRYDRFETESKEQDGEDEPDHPLAEREVGEEIPDEQAQQEQAEGESEGRVHGLVVARGRARGGVSLRSTCSPKRRRLCPFRFSRYRRP